MEINLLDVASRKERMSLELRLEKAIANIDFALAHPQPSWEIEKPIRISGIEYLTNQKQLLIALLKASTW